MRRTNVTVPNTDDVDAFLDQVEPDAKREEARALNDLFKRTTGWAPVMWTGGIIGFGRYEYETKSGCGGSWFATGFSPRKAKHSVYIMPGYTDFSAILARLGPHSTGKSCLYLKKLADIDLEVLGELVRAGLDDLGQSATIEAT